MGERGTGTGTVAAQDATQDEMTTIGRRAGTGTFSMIDGVAAVVEGGIVVIAMDSVEVEQDKSARRAPPHHQRRESRLRT